MMYLNSDLCSTSRDSEKSLMPCMVKGSGLSSLPFLRGQERKKGRNGLEKWPFKLIMSWRSDCRLYIRLFSLGGIWIQGLLSPFTLNRTLLSSDFWYRFNFTGNNSDSESSWPDSWLPQTSTVAKLSACNSWSPCPEGSLPCPENGNVAHDG